MLGATAFALFTGTVPRTCHHLAGVRWQAEASTQAAPTVAWTAIAGGLMFRVTAARAAIHLGAEAALLAVAVAKLFLIELADHGGLYRIVSFIVGCALLLVVGYFAPVPPRQAGPATTEGSA